MNLVVWVADALRVDHVGCYGAQHVATPTIDELAAGGVRFDQAISAAPWTAPSTASMITGLYPHRHGYLHWDAELDPALPTLFTVAAAYGYETGSFVFDERYLFRDFAGRERRGHERAARRRGRVAARAGREAVLPLVPQLDDAHALRRPPLRAQGVAAGEGGHHRRHPVRRPGRARGAARELPRGGGARVREHFAGFLQALDELGLREQTAIAFVSDHGESWGERYADKTQVKGTYHMHGADLYDEIVRVPLILAAPGRCEPAVVPSQVSLVDLHADAARAGGCADRRPRRDARCCRSPTASEQGDRPAFVVGTDKGAVSQLALRQPPWKLTVHVQSGEEEAYRLDVDPGELVEPPRRRARRAARAAVRGAGDASRGRR